MRAGSALSSWSWEAFKAGAYHSRPRQGCDERGLPAQEEDIFPKAYQRQAQEDNHPAGVLTSITAHLSWAIENVSLRIPHDS